jgi:hypothetical protein
VEVLAALGLTVFWLLLFIFMWKYASFDPSEMMYFNEEDGEFYDVPQEGSEEGQQE